jgi:hypothetical protein
VLDEDFSVGLGEHDAGPVPDGVDGLPRPLACYLELDAVQMAVAVALDRRFAVALAMHPDRSRDVRLRRLRTGGSATGVASLACGGVIRPGRPLVRPLGVVDV